MPARSAIHGLHSTFPPWRSQDFSLQPDIILGAGGEGIREAEIAQRDRVLGEAQDMSAALGGHCSRVAVPGDSAAAVLPPTPMCLGLARRDGGPG